MAFLSFTAFYGVATAMQSHSFLLSDLMEKVSALSQGRLNMRLVGDDVTVNRFMPPQVAGDGDMAFLTDARYAAALKDSLASVVILREKDVPAVFGEIPEGRRLLLCDNPYAFFAFASQCLFHTAHPAGIHPKAVVEAGAVVDPTATIEALAVIKRGARIGARTVIRSGAVIAEDVVIGSDCLVHANVVIERETQVGNRCIFQPGCIIGGDGFGFAPFMGEWVKIPQVGRVVIGDDVEIGAGTTIDRGALEDTVIGCGTKLDNQIQIAHNDRIGEHVVMAACVGIAGSTSVGDHCMVGGAAMINGHIDIPAKSMVGPATVITGWGTEAAQRTGFFPAMEGREFQITTATVARLPQIRKDVKALERRVAELETLICKAEE